GPPGRDHHRDHGDRRWCRGAAPGVRRWPRRRAFRTDPSFRERRGQEHRMTITAEPQVEGAERELKDGRVVATAGPVVDVEFPPDALPEINTALEMDAELEGQTVTIVAEVAQQIGEG